MVDFQEKTLIFLSFKTSALGSQLLFGGAQNSLALGARVLRDLFAL